MGNSLGGHNTGAKAVRSEKTRPVLGMKEGNRLGSSLASAAGAFASVGVEGAGSFSIVERAAMGCWGRAAMCCWGSYMVLGLQTWAREGAEPARKSRAGPPLAGGIPARARGLGPRDIEARAASVANGRALAEAASKPPEPVGTARAASSGRVAQAPSSERSGTAQAPAEVHISPHPGNSHCP